MSPPKKHASSAKPKRATKAPPRSKSVRAENAPTSKAKPHTISHAKPRGKPNAKPNRRAGPKPAHAKRSVAETSRDVKPDAERRANKPPEKGDRIAKVMARAGLCSRREAERWIEDGRVRINGKRLKSPAYDVARRDRIAVDGKPLPSREPVRLWRYHKPRGLVTTHRDPQQRKTVFDALPEALPRVISVGRLDYNTEGLLLLINDGDLARYLELPATGWLRRYRVRAHGRVTDDHVKTLQDGITVEGVTYGPIDITRDSQQGANQWLTLGLREGKNREVRRVLGALGLEVNRLIRISYGPFQLLDLRPGQTDLVRRKALADQMGPTLAEQFQLAGDEEPVLPPRRGHKKRIPNKPSPGKRDTDQRPPGKKASAKRSPRKREAESGEPRRSNKPEQKSQRKKPAPGKKPHSRPRAKPTGQRSAPRRRTR